MNPRTPTPADAELFVGMVVRHKNEDTGFGVARPRGRIKGFIEPEPGWHRALVAWEGEEGEAGTEQYVDTDKLRGDLIGTLGALAADAGVQMTLYGQPVTTEQLREAATTSAIDRMVNAVDPNGFRLGQIVHLRGFAKGEDKAHVIVGGPSAGRVRLAYCGSERWYHAKWYATEFVITTLQDNAHVKRARRWIEREPFDPDGWKRILIGARYGGVGETVAIAHVSQVQP